MSLRIRQVALIFLTLASLLVPILSPSGTLVVMAVYAGLGSLVAIGLVLLTGVGGMTSFGQAALVGIGAYATAVVTVKLGWSPWLALLAAIALSGLVSLLVGLVTVRLSGYFLPLGTIAWGLAIFHLFGAVPFLGGYDGLAGIPPLRIGGVDLIDPRAFYSVVWVILALVVISTLNLLDSRCGRVVRSLRTGRIAMEAFGVGTWRFRIIVFVYAGVLAGISGWLFAVFQRAVSASPFGLGTGIEYLLMAVLGGAGHVFGAILGAIIVVLARNVFQDVLPMLLGNAGNFQAIAFGVLLVGMLQFAPAGIFGPIGRLFARGASPGKADGEALPPAPAIAEENPLLDVRRLEKRFGGLVAVNQVGFTVGRAETVALIGPNGAGKSTTFNLITGLLPATAGEIVFNGRRISGLAAREIARLRIARTFQHVKLVGDMSVIDNVAAGAYLRSRSGFLSAMLRLNRSEEVRIRATAMKALRLAGLEEKAHMRADALALGQMRVVEIARALCLDPVLLLLDEPAAGLRAQEKAALARLLKELALNGTSVLIVEHDMEFVMSVADRLVVLNFGTKLTDGKPEEVRRNPQVVEAYLGGVE